MCPPMLAHWRHLANTTELVLASVHRVHNPNCKSIGSAVSAQLTAESLYTLGDPFPQNHPFSWGDLDPI